MSYSGESKTPEKESQPAEQEFKSQECEKTKSSNKRSLDEDSKNESSGLETTLKKVAKSTARKLVFERTEEDDLFEKQSSSSENLKSSAKPTARKLEFGKTEEDDGLPLACSICRKPFLDPVVTDCNHYFCNLCALMHHENNTNCFVCNQPTFGVYNTAVEIKKKIARFREKAEAMVKEVSTRLEEAVVISKNADAMTAESAGIVEEVETMVGILEAHGAKSAEDPSSWDSVVKLVENVEVIAAKARDMAEKAAEMVKEANAMAERAKAEMVKAWMVMKKVEWNV